MTKHRIIASALLATAIAACGTTRPAPSALPPCAVINANDTAWALDDLAEGISGRLDYEGGTNRWVSINADGSRTVIGWSRSEDSPLMNRADCI